MLKNYLKIFVRNVKKSPGYMSINILGLSVGMAVSLLILLFIQHELSYDRYHEKADRIYRVSRSWFSLGGEVSLHLGHAAPPFAPLIKSDFEGQVEEAVRVMKSSAVIKKEADAFTEERLFFADPEIFDVFSWPLLEGDASRALTFPDGMVISESMANKYFGGANPMGQMLEINISGLKFDMIVRGVMQDIPDNSHFKADFFTSMEPVVDYYGGYEQMMKNFGGNNFGTYLLLAEDVNPKELESQLPAFIDRHMAPSSQGILASQGTKLHLRPITDIHLHSNLDSELEPNGSMENVYIYSAIAIFILLIACINFMNLATARSAKRAMEVGLRKVMGADRTLLVKQFMGETVLIAVIALVFALLLSYASLSAFSNFIGKELSLNLIQHPEYILALLILVLFVGLLAGSYPSLFLSGFQPVKVLKGTYRVGTVHEKFRSFLVSGQFAVSIILIVSVLVVWQQLDYMKQKDLGFNKDQLVILPAYREFTNNYETLRDRYLQHKGIDQLALGSRIPSGRLLDSQGTQAEVNGELTPLDVMISDVHVSHSFMETFGIKMAAGRDFDYGLASDSTQAFIINESAVRAIGWTDAENALGKQFNYGERRGYVVGVVKDFHFESLHQPISPMVFMIPDDRYNSVAIRVNREFQQETMDYLRQEWQALRPNYPFTYYTVADRFDQQYDAEEKVAAVFGFFASLAIIISMLGLFGLSTYSTEQRTKEIGIRKVMGASVSSIVLLLGRDFLKLVLIGFLFAVPVAWYGMKGWLGNFAYSVDISWTVFLIAGMTAALIATLTVSSQSVKAALTNPVDTFKAE